MSDDNAAPGLDPEHHQHPDPNEGDEAGAKHQHDNLPAHFHRDGRVFSPWPAVYPDPRRPEETAE
jgi:hypothetical protein